LSFKNEEFKMNLYEELGKVQFQLDKLEQAKNNIVRQIEIQMTIESVKQEINKQVEPIKND